MNVEELGDAKREVVLNLSERQSLGSLLSTNSALPDSSDRATIARPAFFFESLCLVQEMESGVYQSRNFKTGTRRLRSRVQVGRIKRAMNDSFREPTPVA